MLEVGVETVPADAGKSPADLAQRYGEAQFKAELPEAICGESDRASVKIDNAKQVLEEARVVYTADVTCPEIKFLGLGERRAMVQFLITPGLRYRLMARALKEDFEKRKEAVDAFFASFPQSCPRRESGSTKANEGLRRRLSRLQLRPRRARSRWRRSPAGPCAWSGTAMRRCPPAI